MQLRIKCLKPANIINKSSLSLATRTLSVYTCRNKLDDRSITLLVMVALWNRPLYFCPVVSSSFFFFLA